MQSLVLSGENRQTEIAEETYSLFSDFSDLGPTPIHTRAEQQRDDHSGLALVAKGLRHVQH